MLIIRLKEDGKLRNEYNVFSNDFFLWENAGINKNSHARAIQSNKKSKFKSMC